MSDVVSSSKGESGWAIQFVARYRRPPLRRVLARFHGERSVADRRRSDMSLVGVLEHTRRTPDKPDRRRRRGDAVTYAGDGDWAAALAGGPQARGVGAGDVVGVAYNSIEFRDDLRRQPPGAVAMPINWRLAAQEVRFILDHSEARALVCDEDLVDLGGQARPAVSTPPRPRVRLHRRSTRGGSASPTSGPASPGRAPGAATTSTG